MAENAERPTVGGARTLTTWLRDGRVVLTREVSMAVMSEVAGVAVLEVFRRDGGGGPHGRIAGFNLADVVRWSLETV